jgi:hypothetical protein
MVALSMVAATEAIKCLCDKPFCLDDAAEKEEECPARYDADFFDKYPSLLEKMKADMPLGLVSIEILKRQVKGEPPFTQDEIQSTAMECVKKVEELMSKLSNAEKVRLSESVIEIGAITLANTVAGKSDLKAMIEMMDQALNGTYEPKHAEYNFCIKKIDGTGITSRSCGLRGADKLGLDMKLGCHKNPMYAASATATANDYPKYCRCDIELCNSGDVKMTDEEASKPSKNLANLLAGSLMLVCFSVVVSQICRD